MRAGEHQRPIGRREAWLSAGGVFLIALAVRLWAASFVVFARPEDAAYYVNVAQHLVAGRGLVSDAIWSYQTPPLTFPRPAFEVWLPLPSFLYAIPMLVLGPTLLAAQLASTVIGSIVAVLAWRLGLDAMAGIDGGTAPAPSLARVRAVSLGAGLTAAVFLPLVLASAEPDSTAPFAALVLGACLLMTRLGYSGDGHHRQQRDRRALIGLGLLLGLAALTRNEAIWLALTWAVVAARGTPRTAWPRMIGVPAVVALAVFAPWAIRDWLTFGTPLPGQALTNALSLHGTDIFAWQDPPTLASYLAAGPETLIALRIVGFLHNLVDVLLLLGTPVAAIGLVALPWTARGQGGGRAARGEQGSPLGPLLAFGVITFVATTLLFPVATTWGTFLHAAGAIEVLLIVSAVLALDRIVEAVKQRLHWTQPVAWFGPALTIASTLLLTAVLLPSEGRAATATRDRYEALPDAMNRAGASLDTAGPVITDFPIWFAATTGHAALALPDESPSSVADLAAHFGASFVVVDAGNGGAFVQGLRTGADPKAPCFTPLPMTHLGDDPDPLAGVSVYAIRCP